MNLFLLNFVVFFSVTRCSRSQPAVDCGRDFPTLGSVTFDQVFTLISENGWNETVSAIRCLGLHGAMIPQNFPQFPELSYLSQISCF